MVKELKQTLFGTGTTIVAVGIELLRREDLQTKIVGLIALGLGAMMLAYAIERIIAQGVTKGLGDFTCSGVQEEEE